MNIVWRALSHGFGLAIIGSIIFHPKVEFSHLFAGCVLASLLLNLLPVGVQATAGVREERRQIRMHMREQIAVRQQQIVNLTLKLAPDTERTKVELARLQAEAERRPPPPVPSRAEFARLAQDEFQEDMQIAECIPDQSTREQAKLHAATKLRLRIAGLMQK
jgi:hypothetical protein